VLSRSNQPDWNVVRMLVEACRAACEACAKHAPHMQHCAVCADTCRVSAEACDRFLESSYAA
jgi:hypothetical protein